MKSLKLSNSEYIDTTEEEVTPEERMGLNPPTEEKLQRTNPKRYDPRTDWYNQLNEHGHDSPVENRYDNSIALESSLRLAWQMTQFKKSSLKLSYDNIVDELTTGQVGVPFFYNTKTGLLDTAGEGDAHFDIPSYKKYHLNATKPLFYKGPASQQGIMYGRISPQKNTIVFWMPMEPTEEDYPYVVECVYYLQQKKELAQNPQVYFSGGNEVYSLQSLKSMFFHTESSLKEIIENLDWEIERTIEASSGLKVANIDKESFIDKIKRRYGLAVKSFQIPPEMLAVERSIKENPKLSFQIPNKSIILKNLNKILKELMQKGDYDKGQRFSQLYPISAEKAREILGDVDNKFDSFFIAKRIFHDYEYHYEVIGVTWDVPEILGYAPDSFVPGYTQNSTTSSLLNLDKFTSSNAEINSKIFQQRVERSGDNGPEAFWGSKEGQDSRFQFLLTFGNKLSDDQLHNMYDNKSILDVGTGYGDLLKYLQNQNIESEKFVGVDIEPKAIQVAKKQDPTASFLVRDILKDPFPENSFDYVIGVGIFALNCDNYMQYVRDMLKSMLKSCKIMAAVNFPAGQSPQGDYMQVTPEMIKDLLNSGITRAYSIEIDNVNQEFALYLIK